MQWLITMRQHLCIMLMKISGMQQKRQMAKADMEEAEGRMGDLSYCAEEIAGYFVKYFYNE